MSAQPRLLPKSDTRARSLVDGVEHVLRGADVARALDGTLEQRVAQDFAQLAILVVLARDAAPSAVALDAWLRSALALVTLDDTDRALARARLETVCSLDDLVASSVEIEGAWSRFYDALVDEVTRDDDDVARAAAVLALSLIS